MGSNLVTNSYSGVFSYSGRQTHLQFWLLLWHPEDCRHRTLPQLPMHSYMMTLGLEIDVNMGPLRPKDQIYGDLGRDEPLKLLMVHILYWKYIAGYGIWPQFYGPSGP